MKFITYLVQIDKKKCIEMEDRNIFLSSSFYISIWIIMKKAKLNFLWKDYNLKIYESKYDNNWKPYFGLIDAKTWEAFSDITVNLSTTDKKINWIDNDFSNCFKNWWDLKSWLEKYLNIKSFGIWYCSWFYYFTL